MNFASKYGYDYGFQGSDLEEYSDEEEDSLTKKKKIVKSKIRKADTNVISVTFDSLVSPNEMFAGEPKLCKNCEAFMSPLSVKNISNKLWKCEFCYTDNDISTLIDDLNEIPQKYDVTYFIEGPKETQSSIKTEVQPLNEGNYLTLCIDVSGSMDTNIETRTNCENYMTRLQGVKISSIETLKNLNESEPNKKVSLVTFSDQVKFYGDTSERNPLVTIVSHENDNVYRNYSQLQTNQQSKPKKTIAGRIKSLISSNKSKSNSSDDETSTSQEQSAATQESKEDKEKNRIIEVAKNIKNIIKPISQTYASFETKIKSLETEGSTALGPALVFSIEFSSRIPGSSVILCTDGCANVGVGKLDGSLDEAQAEKFYEDLSQYAVQKAVTVNVISMQGTDCKLALLGKVANMTNGTLSIVNPANLADELKSILENRVIATNVEAKLIVNHKFIYIRDDQFKDLTPSVVSKNIGNANIDTEITFEYGIKKLNQQEANPLNELPFQLQIKYTLSDGSKAVRCYTKLQEFTKNRSKAEEAVESKETLFIHAIQSSNKHVLLSDVRQAKAKTRQQERFFTAQGYSAPEMFVRNNNLVKNLSERIQMSSLEDQAAENVYKSSKVSRNLLKKK